MNKDYAKPLRQALIAGTHTNEQKLAAAKAALGDKYLMAPCNQVQRQTPHKVVRLETRSGTVAFIA